MKNKYTKLKKRLKTMWKKEYLLWGIVIIWSLLFWEGHRILPGTKWLSEVIPAWIVIVNLAILFISITLLINKRHFPLIGIVITLVGFLFSCIFLRIGYQRYPLVSLIGAGMVILVNLGLKIWSAKAKK